MLGVKKQVIFPLFSLTGRNITPILRKIAFMIFRSMKPENNRSLFQFLPLIIFIQKIYKTRMKSAVFNMDYCFHGMNEPTCKDLDWKSLPFPTSLHTDPSSYGIEVKFPHHTETEIFFRLTKTGQCCNKVILSKPDQVGFTILSEKWNCVKLEGHFPFCMYRKKSEGTRDGKRVK